VSKMMSFSVMVGSWRARRSVFGGGLNRV